LSIFFSGRISAPVISRAGNKNFSHFGPEANLFSELEAVFREYSETGTGRTRHYVHDDVESDCYGMPPGEFTEWESFPEGTDLLFYEGLHGAVKTEQTDVAQYADLKVGVVPVTNLEWIQKIHRDKVARGYSAEAITDTILRRMPDYLSARADCRYVKPVYRTLDSNRRRIDGCDSIRESARYRFPLPFDHDS
jgi:phosphoribulokinase